MGRWSYVVAILTFLACKEVTPDTYESTGELLQPDTSSVPVTAALPPVEDQPPNVSAAIIEKKEELREEKKDQSPFRRLGCCDAEGTKEICCCEPVYKEYVVMLKEMKPEVLAAIRAQDPIFNECYKGFPVFKKKIDEAEMGEEEE